MECSNCNCVLNGDYLEVDERFYCSSPCAQVQYVGTLERSIANNARGVKRQRCPQFIKLINAERLLMKAILKHTKTEHLLRMRKLVMERMVEAMEFSISDEGNDGTVDSEAYLMLANETKIRLEGFDSYIKLFGSP